MWRVGRPRRRRVGAVCPWARALGLGLAITCSGPAALAQSADTNAPQDPAPAARPAPDSVAPAPAAQAPTGARAAQQAAAGPSERDQRRAVELHDQAKQLYVQGRYHEAVDQLKKALALDPNNKDLHYILAFVAEKLSDLELALEHYRVSARLEVDGAERERLQGVVRRLEGARRHAPPGSPRSQGVASELPPRSASVGDDSIDVGPWPYLAAGLAGAALFTGGVLAAHAVAVDPGSGARTDSRTSVADLQADADSAHGSAVGADVAFIVGGVAGAVAVILLIVDRSGAQRGSESSARWRSPQGGRAGLAWRF